MGDKDKGGMGGWEPRRGQLNFYISLEHGLEYWLQNMVGKTLENECLDIISRVIYGLFMCLNRHVIMNHNRFYLIYWLLKCCETNAQTVLEWGRKDGMRIAELISQNVSYEFIFMVAWCSIKHVYVPVDSCMHISNGMWQSIAQSILIADCGNLHYMRCNMAVYIAQIWGWPINFVVKWHFLFRSENYQLIKC